MFAFAVFVASALLAQADDTTSFDKKVCDCPAADTDSIDTFDKCLQDKYTASTCQDAADVTATVTSTVDKKASAIKVAKPAAVSAVLSQIDLTPIKTAATCAKVIVTDGTTPVEIATTPGATLTIAIDAKQYAAWAGDLTITCKDDTQIIFAEDGNNKVTSTFKYTSAAPTGAPPASSNSTKAPEGTGFNMGVASLLGAAAIFTAL